MCRVGDVCTIGVLFEITLVQYSHACILEHYNWSRNDQLTSLFVEATIIAASTRSQLVILTPQYKPYLVLIPFVLLVLHWV